MPGRYIPGNLLTSNYITMTIEEQIKVLEGIQNRFPKHYYLTRKMIEDGHPYRTYQTHLCPGGRLLTAIMKEFHIQPSEWGWMNTGGFITVVPIVNSDTDPTIPFLKIESYYEPEHQDAMSMIRGTLPKTVYFKTYIVTDFRL